MHAVTHLGHRHRDANRIRHALFLGILALLGILIVILLFRLDIRNREHQPDSSQHHIKMISFRYTPSIITLNTHVSLPNWRVIDISSCPGTSWIFLQAAIYQRTFSHLLSDWEGLLPSIRLVVGSLLRIRAPPALQRQPVSRTGPRNPVFLRAQRRL